MNPTPDQLLHRSPPETTNASAALNRRDDHFYEELSRINNELANAQRALAGRNADLTTAQGKLRTSERRYRNLSACSPIAILEMSAAGFCLYTNPHWETITGLTDVESLGDGWQRAFDGADALVFLEAWTLALHQGSEFHGESRFVTKKGAPRWVQVRSRSIRNDEGDLAGHVSTVEDITEQKQAEKALAKAHTELVDLSRRAGMAEIASNVLHNVGNVLNSVNISTGLVVEKVKKSKVANLVRAVALMQEHAQDLGAFMTHDSKGKQLPAYLAQLSELLLTEQATSLRELDSLRRNVEHIEKVVTMQQKYAHVGGVKETINVVDLVEDSLRIDEGALSRHRLEVVREFEEVPPLTVEKHKVLQILVNLLRNARYACAESSSPDKRLTVRVAGGNGQIKVSVMDNGVGISPENLPRLFHHGFTTREEGHGFGLHSSALAAREIGGSLTASSGGLGQGALFTLTLPVGAGQTV